MLKWKIRDKQRKVLLRSVVVVAQKGLGVALDGVAECEPDVPDAILNAWPPPRLR